MDDNWGSPRESLTCSGSQLKIMHRTDAFKPTTCWFCCGKLGFSQGGCTYWHECCYLLIRCLFRWFLLFWEFLFCFRMLVDVSWFMSLYPIVHRHWLHTYCTHIDCDDHPLCCLYTWQTFSNYYVYYIITYHHNYVCICGTILYIIMYTSYLDGRWLPSLCGKPVASNEVKQKKT